VASTREPGADLRADCANCFALCCVAPAFAPSADFPIVKPAGRPCLNLRADFRCGIHDSLRPRGFRGCAVYDCFGAGQKVSQVTFGGRDWRRDPGAARPMFAAFAVMFHLHELLWYVTEALALERARPLHAELEDALAETERLTRLDAAALVALDADAHRGKVDPLLREASELARAGLHGPELRRADLAGADLRGADLRGADLRGASLIGADLAGADLRTVDLIGADTRDADLSGADLSGALFLIQAQLDAARGDAATRLPPALARPGHWGLTARPEHRTRPRPRVRGRGGRRGGRRNTGRG